MSDDKPIARWTAKRQAGVVMGIVTARMTVALRLARRPSVARSGQQWIKHIRKGLSPVQDRAQATITG